MQANELPQLGKVLSFPLSEIKDPRYRAVAKELSYSTADYWVEPAMDPEYSALPSDMDVRLVKALGVSSLYGHQLEAWEALRNGQSVVLQTPTASGKTLSFNPAIMQDLLTSDSTAAYIFPLKALCNDQQETIEKINGNMGNPLNVILMTGDVDKQQRLRLWNARRCPQIVLWSPDVLHNFLFNAQTRKLAEWEHFSSYLRNLRYVVVDEAHTYRGVLGSHFANIRRRLELAVEKAGGNPSQIQYIFATATVSNGREMIRKFSGRDDSQFTVIDKSGAGSRGRVVIAMKPTSSQNQDAVEIIRQWFAQGITGIVFSNSRVQTKALLRSIRREIGASAAAQVETYYGGMKPGECKRVVSALQSKKATLVISTKALEAGINIPALDACLLLGFGESIMDFRQRIGRAGRLSEALVIFLPSDSNALDGYYGEEPRRLLNPPESIQFNSQYPSILSAHLCCAATESGIPVGREDELFGKGAKELLEALSVKGWEYSAFGETKQCYPKIYGNEWGAYTIPGTNYPHGGVAIRGNDATQVAIVDSEGEELEKLDKSTAIREVYPGAIYQVYSDGKLKHYWVNDLDLSKLEARVSRCTDENLLSYPQTGINVRISKGHKQQKILKGRDGNFRLSWGIGAVVNSTFGYRLLRKTEVSQCFEHGATIQNGKCTKCGKRGHTSTKLEPIDAVTFDKPFVQAMTVPVLQIEINPDILRSLAECVQGLQLQHKEDIEQDNVASLFNENPEFIGLHSLGHQLQAAYPTLVLGSSHDIDCHVASPAPEDYVEDARVIQAKLWIYDTTPGGNGATEVLFNDFENLAKAAYKFASLCQCKHGCPRCTMAPRCGQRNKGLNKELGLFLLSQLL